MIARAGDGRLERHFSFAFQTSDEDLHFFRLHNVAALSNRRNRLIRAMCSNRKIARHCVAFAEATTSIGSQLEFDAVGDRDFSRVANKVAAYCWIHSIKILFNI